MKEKKIKMKIHNQINLKKEEEERCFENNSQIEKYMEIPIKKRKIDKESVHKLVKN